MTAAKMTVTKIESLGKKRYLIKSGNTPLFVLYGQELKSYGLEEEKEISRECYGEILESVLKKRALLRCLHLLERKDYTEWQLRQKLREGYYPDEVADLTMEDLKGYGYLDDSRYAERYMEYKLKSKSLRAVITDLKQKGISRDIIDSAMEHFDYEKTREDQRNTIVKLLTKRHYYDNAGDPKEKARQYRFLAGKGYDAGDIKSALDLDMNL